MSEYAPRSYPSNNLYLHLHIYMRHLNKQTLKLVPEQAEIFLMIDSGNKYRDFKFLLVYHRTGGEDIKHLCARIAKHFSTRVLGSGAII